MRLRRFVGSLAVAVLTGALPALPAVADSPPGTLYVDGGNPDCSDTGAGAGSLTPLCTLGAAAARVVPGQTVLVEPWGYQEQLNITRSGEPGKPITFEGALPMLGSEATISPAGGERPAVTVSGAHDVVLRNLNPYSADELFLVTDSSRVTIDHNELKGRSLGTEPLIRLTGTTTDTTVSRNWLYSETGPGIQVDAGVSGTTVSTNWLNGLHGGILATGAPGTVVTSNTVSGGCAPEISVGEGSTGSTVENNILTHSSNPVGLKCATDHVPADLAVPAGTTADYNVVNGSYSWAGTRYTDATALLAATGQGRHDSNADAGSAGDTLNPGSPAIDSADPNAPGELPTDLFGVPAVRDPQAPSGPSVRDRGAFERQGLSYPSVVVGTEQGAAPLTTSVGIDAKESWPGGTLSYSYDFGDGTPVVSSATNHTDHVYQQPGVYIPSVTVSDSFGSKRTATPIRPVRIYPPGPPIPVLNATPDPGQVRPLTYALDLSHSRGPWPIFHYELDFGDGSWPIYRDYRPHQPAPEHTYPAAGVYPVKLTVIDSSGASATLTKPVTVGYAPGRFVSHEPVRVLDTRNGIGDTKGRLGPDSELTLALTYASVTDWNATAAVLNLTAVNPDAGSYLTAYPSGGTRPATSNSNVTPGQTVAHLVTVPIGSDGKIKIYNHSGHVDVVADLVGWYSPSASAGFTPLTPRRVLDTRTGGGAKVGPGGKACFPAPADAPGATGLVLNVTATRADRDGYLSPGGGFSTSLLNFQAGEDVANQVVLTPSNGQYCLGNFTGHTHIVADLTGYYGSGGGLFTPVAPARLLDSRSGAPIGPDASRALQVAGQTGIPADAAGAVLNVTATRASSGGYLTVYPSGGDRPGTSSVNFTAGQTVPNHVTTGLGPDGAVELYNRSGTTDAVVDVFGYFSAQH